MEKKSAREREEALLLGEVNKPLSENYLIEALILSSDKALPIVRKYLPYPEMFFDPTSRMVYETVLKLSDGGKEVDLLSVSSANSFLTVDRLTRYFSGDIYLQVGSSTSKEKIETHAQIVREAYLKQQIYTKMLGNKSMSEVLEHVAELERKGTDRFLDPKDVLAQVSSVVFNEAPSSAIKYPFPMLNRATNGMHKGQYIIIAARPGAGKTTFLENVAFAVATQGKRVLFASAEMPGEDLFRRTLTHMTGINLFFREEKLTDEEKIEVDFAMKKLQHLKLFVHEFRSTSQLEALIKDKSKYEETKFDLVVVDYVQLLDAKNPNYKSNYERVSAVSRELNGLAKSYKIPFLCAAQLGRGVDGGSQPTYSDLKESGQIEQDADLIVTLWEHKDDPRSPRQQKIRMDILKNRNGFTFGNVQDKEYFLLCDRAMFKFEDPTVLNAPRF